MAMWKRHPLFSSFASRFFAAALCAVVALKVPCVAASKKASTKEPARQFPLPKANVLPLALSDDFEFRKATVRIHQPRTEYSQFVPMLAFDRLRRNFGAISNFDREERYGSYFTLQWRTRRPANLTVRIEYRQENLASHVQAKELYYPNVKGSVTSLFNVIGDEYLQDGRITAWRAVLIENGRIVALHQSFLWN
jgi:hypothetical protein